MNYLDNGKSASGIVTDYILSIDFFTLNNLRQRFPNIANNAIQYAVFQAKKKGLITAIGRGQYIVNKNM